MFHKKSRGLSFIAAISMMVLLTSCYTEVPSESAVNISTGEKTTSSNAVSTSESTKTNSQGISGTTGASVTTRSSGGNSRNPGSTGGLKGPSQYSYKTIETIPQEDKAVVLNNPDMGWMVYENYCVARNQSVIPGSAGYMKDYTYPGVEYVAVMFTWADVEISEGTYFWDDVDRAYDYWKSKGKKLMLRMSTESLLWYGSTGKGIPDYLYDRIPNDQKQTLTTLQGNPPTSYTYRGVDFRNKDYQKRLRSFLTEVNKHFGKSRPVEYIDLAGYGLWGEWHAGYIYPGQLVGNVGPGNLDAKTQGLREVLDIWSDAFPKTWLSLSYSYDPDSPSRFFRDPDELASFEKWSAFDYALTKSNITWRRNGAGGAVQPTDRVFGEKAFKSCKGPFATEAAQGYVKSTVSSLVDDELSLHPNYMNIPGWGWQEARSFLEEQPALFKKGLLNMGYRLVPTKVKTPDMLSRGQTMNMSVSMINRAVGKAPMDYAGRIVLTNSSGKKVASFALSAVPTSSYIKGKTYPEALLKGTVPTSIATGKYRMTFALYDNKHDCYVSMAVNGQGAASSTGGIYLGEVTVL